MKAKNILLISAILLAVIFIAPVKVYMQGKLNVKLNFVEQETRELAKMQKMKVKIRTTFSKLVLAGNVDPLKVEEAHFNEKGQLTEKLSFNTQGLLFRYLFTYNAQGLQTKKVTYDSNNKIIETEWGFMRNRRTDTYKSLIKKNGRKNKK